MCLFNVKRHFQTEEICKLAVQQNGCALSFVRDNLQTEEMYKLAVQQNAITLAFVRNYLQTEEICKLADLDDIEKYIFRF